METQAIRGVFIALVYLLRAEAGCCEKSIASLLKFPFESLISTDFIHMQIHGNLSLSAIGSREVVDFSIRDGRFYISRGQVGGR
jgi:hypothetical protein